MNIVMNKVLQEIRRTKFFMRAKDGFQEEFEGEFYEQLKLV